MSSKSTMVVLFWLVALIYLVADANTITTLTYITKPALLSILLIYFWWSVGNKRNQFCLWMLAGLIFSVAGDSFLMFEGDLFFMLGLGSFLLTHVFYILAFCNYANCSPNHYFSARKWPLFLFMVYMVSFMAYLWIDLGNLRWPVLVYGSAIALMGLSAYNLKGQIPQKVFLLLFIGAVLFIFSDSIIALEKFKSDQLNIPNTRLLIMIPYLLAQYLIVMGALGAYRHKTQ